MRQISVRTLALFAAIGALGPSRPAAAYVRTTTQDGQPLHWQQGCVQMSPGNASGPGAVVYNGLTAQQVGAVLGRAASNWDRPTASCSALSVHAGAPQDLPAQDDGVNVLVFDISFWGRGQLAYDPSAAAVTSVAYVNHPGDPSHGSITDADTELNAVDFTFAEIDPDNPGATPDPDNGTRLADLENTVTHELGHVLGLGHTCWDHISPTPPLDQNGQPIPDCFGPLPASIVTTTMFPYFADGETSKRNLSPDDIHGLCGSYPEGSALQTCPDTVIPGCQIGERGAHGGANAGVRVLVVLMGLVLLVRRRLRS